MTDKVWEENNARLCGLQGNWCYVHHCYPSTCEQMGFGEYAKPRLPSSPQQGEPQYSAIYTPTEGRFVGYTPIPQQPPAAFGEYQRRYTRMVKPQQEGARLPERPEYRIDHRGNRIVHAYWADLIEPYIDALLNSLAEKEAEIERLKRQNAQLERLFSLACMGDEKEMQRLRDYDTEAAKESR